MSCSSDYTPRMTLAVSLGKGWHRRTREHTPAQTRFLTVFSYHLQFSYLLIHLPRGHGGGIPGLLSIPSAAFSGLCSQGLSDPCRMESGVQDLIMNEIMRRLGVTLTPKCLETSRNAKITTECLSLEALGMSNLGGRKDWRACPEASYFYLACVFFWLSGGW